MQTGAGGRGLVPRVDQLLTVSADSGKAPSLSALICVNTGTLPSRTSWGDCELMDGKHILPPDVLYLEFP